MTAAGVLDLWEAGLPMSPAARAVLLLEATGHDDVRDWPVGERDRVLLEEYCTEPGATDAVAQCPACGTTLDLVVDPHLLAEPPPLPREPPPLPREPPPLRREPPSLRREPPPLRREPSVVLIESDGYRVRARPPTAGDLAGIVNAVPDESDAHWLLTRCVLEAERGGQAVVGPTDLPDQVVVAIEQALDEADPAADIHLTLTCIECRTAWLELFDPVRFAWSSVERRARSLATDVHELARAYGWSEREILELSWFRRHLYLSAVQP